MRRLLTVLAAAVLSLLALAPAASAATANSTCYNIYELAPTTSYYLGNPGLHNVVKTVSSSSTCYTFNATGGFVDGYSVYRLRINGGGDCLKLVYPDNPPRSIYDEPCDTSSNEWFIRVLTSQGWYYLDPAYQGNLYAGITTAALGNGQDVYSGTSPNCNTCGNWYLAF